MAEGTHDNSSRKRKPSRLIETYFVQCGKCNKWRSIKSQEKYEEIRSEALNKSFECKNNCREPGDVDVEGDSTRVWCEDQLQGLSKTPKGFMRIMVLRESCDRVDVCYRTPQGKRLRSCKEFAGFIQGNQGFTDLHINDISFAAPKVIKKKTKFKDVAAPTNKPALVLKACETLSKKKPNKKRSKSSLAINLDGEEGKLMRKSLQNERPATDKWGIESSNNVLLSQNGKATPSKKKRKRDKGVETREMKKQNIENDKNIEKEACTKISLKSDISSSNEVIIEELEKTKSDGKVAANGKKVSILYTGKLKDTGNVFDSNIGEAPLRVRLGTRKVIKGLNNGIEGMRAGDKRRITIPPSLGYSEEGFKDVVPKNAWLVYEVEAVKVR